MYPTADHLPTFTRYARGFLKVLRRMRRLLWRGALCGTPLLVVTVLTHNFLAERSWRAYRQQAEKQGTPLDLPKTPPAAIPDKENFAAADGPFSRHDSSRWLDNFAGMHLRSPNYGAGERMTTEKAYAENGFAPIQVVYRGMAHRGEPRPAPMPPELTQPRSAEDFLAICEHDFGSQWPAILEAEARPKTQLAPKVDPLSEQGQLSALNIRKTAQVHGMRAMAFLDLGRHAEALEEIKAGFRLVHGIERSPDIGLVTFMIDQAILSLDLSNVWEGLVDRRWTDDELLVLRDELASFHPTAQWSRVMDSERATQNSAYDELATGPLSRRIAYFENLGGKPKNAAEYVGRALVGSCFTTGIARDNQLVSNKLWDGGRQLLSADGRWHPEAQPGVEDLINFGTLERYHYCLAFMACPSMGARGLPRRGHSSQLAARHPGGRAGTLPAAA